MKSRTTSGVQSVREYYQTSYGTFQNHFDLTIGMNYNFHGKKAFRFESGIYLSGAFASTTVSLGYAGIERTESWMAESVQYHFYCLEIPARIGYRFSKKYPVSITMGIIPAIGLNVSNWKFTETKTHSQLDANGNLVTTTSVSQYDQPLQSQGAIVGTCAELRVPIIPLKNGWISFSLGANGYLTSLTRFVHHGAMGTHNIMRLSHNLFYLRVNIPFSFEPKYESVSDGPTDNFEYR